MKSITTIAILFTCFSLTGSCQTRDGGEDTGVSPVISFKEIGRVKTRTTHEISSSPWYVGGETMDRDYTIYKNWKEYVEPLGIKKVRIQGGWAKTEKEVGQYNWDWLDEIIFDLDKKGVQPWVCLSYGNSLYADGGGTLLGAALPKTDEAMEGWLNWVRAFVKRYGNIVREWEIWNEPNLRNANAPSQYAAILMKTSKAIREVQPDAVIIAMATAGVDIDFISRVLQIAKDNNMLEYIDRVSYHPYKQNPDESYEEVMKLRSAVNGFDPRIILMQGENGAPSIRRNTKALRNYDWTETSQAKWALRRLLGDLGHDIPSSIFSIIDMKYPDEMNAKGLLAANDDKTVSHRKLAYFAVQNMVAIFDDQVERITDFKYEVSHSRDIAVYGYHHKDGNTSMINLWFSDKIPSDDLETSVTDIALNNMSFSKPVWVDLLSGKIYEIPKKHLTKGGFTNLPVYDSPVLITERSLVMK